VACVGDGTTLYISDVDNGRIAKVPQNASNATVTAFSTINGDYSYPGGLALDPSGNLYVAEQGWSQVIKITSAGATSSVAGIHGTFDASGDGGPATSAGLGYPAGLAFGPGGELYIVDGGSNAIRKVSGGTITTVAGQLGVSGYQNSATPTQALFSSPLGLAATSQGVLYISDQGNQRIRRCIP